MTAPTPPRLQPVYPGLLKLDYTLYKPKDFKLSSDKTTLTSYNPRLCTSPGALVSLMQLLATVPPKPQIRIRGNNGNDFDVKINLMTMIVPEDNRRPRMNYIKVIGPGEKGFRGDTKETTTPTITGGLEEWARIFCEDPAALKQFTLERTVINWDTTSLEGRILSLISNISYRGQVTVTFPVTHSRVVVHSPDKVNRFFSNVAALFTGVKRYEVVRSVWPYADMPHGEPGRRCVVQDEDAWWADWKDAIRHAILARTRGWVSVEDRLEFLMEPKKEELVKLAEWGGYG